MAEVRGDTGEALLGATCGQYKLLGGTRRRFCENECNHNLLLRAVARMNQCVIELVLALPCQSDCTPSMRFLLSCHQLHVTRQIQLGELHQLRASH